MAAPTSPAGPVPVPSTPSPTTATRTVGVGGRSTGAACRTGRGVSPASSSGACPARGPTGGTVGTGVPTTVTASLGVASAEGRAAAAARGTIRRATPATCPTWATADASGPAPTGPGFILATEKVSPRNESTTSASRGNTKQVYFSYTRCNNVAVACATVATELGQFACVGSRFCQRSDRCAGTPFSPTERVRGATCTPVGVAPKGAGAVSSVSVTSQGRGCGSVTAIVSGACTHVCGVGGPRPCAVRRRFAVPAQGGLRRGMASTPAIGTSC